MNTIWLSNGLNPDQGVLSVLIWVQIIKKGYQQMTKFAASKERGLNIFYEMLSAYYILLNLYKQF